MENYSLSVLCSQLCFVGTDASSLWHPCCLLSLSMLLTAALRLGRPHKVDTPCKHLQSCHEAMFVLKQSLRKGKNVLKVSHEEVCFPEALIPCGQQDSVIGVKVTGIILTPVLPGFASQRQSQTLVPVSASAPGAETSKACQDAMDSEPHFPCT